MTVPQPGSLLTACCLWLGVAHLRLQAVALYSDLLLPPIAECFGSRRVQVRPASIVAPSSFTCSLPPMQAMLALHAFGSSLSSHVSSCRWRQSWLLISVCTACLRMLPPAAAGNAGSWLVFQVSQHPKVAAKIRQELADLGLLATSEQPQPRQLEWADLAKLQYLNCCIKVSYAAKYCAMRCSQTKCCPIAAVRG